MMGFDAINDNGNATDKEEWSTESLCVKCSESPTSDVSTTKDLSTWFPSTIDQYKHAVGGMKDDERLWLPNDIYDGPSIAKKFNNETCHEAGYSVVVASTKKKKGASKAHKIYIRCEHYRKAAKSIATKYKMKPPVERSGICDWFIPVYLDEQYDRYFIRQNGGHCLNHCGHPPVSVEKERKGVKRNNTSNEGSELSAGTCRKRKSSTTSTDDTQPAMVNPMKQSQYEQVYPNFMEALECVRTDEDVEILNECLDRARAAIISRKTNTGNTS